MIVTCGMPIKDAVHNNKKIVIQAYTVSNNVEKKINEVLEVILKKHDCRMLLAPIYTCIKELLVNAVKANFKNIYFENYSPKNDSDKHIDYEVSLKLFKLEMNRKDAEYLTKIARANNIITTIKIWVDGKDLNFEVLNPVQMTDIEQRNVIQKLKDAREYSDISEYFYKISDDPTKEGAGLGLVLVSLILKSLGVAKNNFKIVTSKNSTKASLKITLDQKTLAIFRQNIA